MEDQAQQNTPDILDDFPEISQGLLDALTRRLPERWPDVNWTLRDIDKRAGAHALISLLQLVFNSQATVAQEVKDKEDNVLRFPSH